MITPPVEKVQFKDGTFGVRQHLGDSFRFASVYETSVYWYTFESDIERFCHMSEKDADYALSYVCDIGNPVAKP
jgi:hypothetical protein